LECYNVTEEEYDEGDPRNVQVLETEGTHAIEGPELVSTTYTQPIKTNQVNIGTMKNPKFAHIGDYWNDETIEKVVDLLQEYQDLFPTTFSEMKGIAGDLGEMKIPLKPEAKPIRQRPYRLNPRYKEKFKAEIECSTLTSLNRSKNLNGLALWCCRIRRLEGLEFRRLKEDE
jgi:hypothetical protein